MLRALGAILAGSAAAATFVFATHARAEDLFGVTADDALVAFDSAHPSAIVRSVRIGGVDSAVVAIAVRPADGALYALSQMHRLYRIDRNTGDATPIGANGVVPNLSGSVAMSFDPATDQLRVLTSSGQNLRVDPVTATTVDGDPRTQGTQPDSPLLYAGGDVDSGFAPAPAAVAHADGVAGGSSTAFVVDAAQDVLARLGDADATGTSRDAGVLHTVGALGVDASLTTTGFDVSRATGRAYLAIVVPGESASKLYGVSLFTGAATLIGGVGVPQPLRSIAVDSAASGSSTTGRELVALTAGGELVRFSADDPTRIERRVAVTGLVDGDSLVAIALRPRNGRLYGISAAGRLYVLNALTGVARAVRTTPFEVALDGTRFGFDFSPISNVARIVSDTGQSLRVVPDTGAVVDADPTTPGIQTDESLRFASDDPFAGPSPTIAAAAFGRGATSSALFGIDPNFDVLVRMNVPSTGVVRSVGALNVDATEPVGFEVMSDGTAFATFGASGGASSLFSIDLTTGAATPLGAIGSSETILSIADVPTSNPPTFGDALRVTALTIRLDLRRADDDAATLVGSMPLPDGGVGGRTVVLDLGGFTKTFTTNARGVARDTAGTRSSLDDDGFRFLGPPSDGRVRFGASLRAESIAAALADEDMSGAANVRNGRRTLRATITVDGVAYATTLTVRYSARVGRSAVAYAP